MHVNRGELPAIKEVFMVQEGPKSLRAEVRAPIGARKPGNAGGAKGCREVDTETSE